MNCSYCHGDHEPDTPEMYVEFRGYRLSPPFLCMCCGKETCGRQFAYGRTCGVCDMGACEPQNTAYRPEYAHEKQEWTFLGDAETSMRLFAEHVNAILLETHA